MKSRKIPYLLTAASAFLLAPGAHAQTISWKAGGNNLWSNTANWDTGVVPNSNNVDARFNINNNVQISVDGTYTVRSYSTGFAANVSNPANEHLLFNNTLTIDLNNAAAANGIVHASNNNIKLRFNCDVTINNTASTPGDTIVLNQNGAANIVEFGNNCALLLNTKLRTGGTLGSLVFNCTFSPSAQDLLIGSNNVSFGSTHNSTNFQRDIILFANSKLAIDAGTGKVLTANRKFQINGTGAELELNTADSINNANIVVGGSNTLLLDVKANQTTMGDVRFSGGAVDGVLTIDIDPAVTSLAFADCSAQAWGSGSIVINGFKENTIRFGTDTTGLSPAQLAAIDGGIYTLTPTGFLTTGTSTNDYASWASSQIPPVTGGENGDDDNDGVSNLVEYALADGGERDVLSGDTLTFTKRGGPYGGDITYTIEVSTDLGVTDDWETAVSGVTEDSTSISYQFTPGSPARIFARLKVVQNP